MDPDDSVVVHETLDDTVTLACHIMSYLEKAKERMFFKMWSAAEISVHTDQVQAASVFQLGRHAKVCGSTCIF